MFFIQSEEVSRLVKLVETYPQKPEAVAAAKVGSTMFSLLVAKHKSMPHISDFC